MHQKAIPISVISKLIHRDGTDLERATGELATIGIFFVMRSCEYLKVAKHDQRRTEILRLAKHDLRRTEILRLRNVRIL